MAAIRPVDQIARKWATVTPQRSGDYETGVREPVRDWATETKNANQAWKDGIQAAVTQNRFEKGVTAAGTARWQEGATTKGVTRWGPGVALAEDRYSSGFAPFRDAIARTTLPPRFARRDPRNLDRVKAITLALAKVKAGGQS